MGDPKMAQFLKDLTLPNINRFSKLFHCQNQEKICTLPSCELSVSKKQQLKTLVSGVAGLSASSSSKADTYDVKSAGCDSYFRQ